MFVNVNTTEYIAGTFALFKRACSGEMVDQIIAEYERDPSQASPRDAMDLAKMMYYSASK